MSVVSGFIVYDLIIWLFVLSLVTLVYLVFRKHAAPAMADPSAPKR
jgi:hypothetical protein